MIITWHVSKEKEKGGPIITEDHRNTRDPGAPIHGGSSGAEGRANVPHRDGQAYTTTTKIYNKKIVQDIYKLTMEALITVTQQELLSLTPELCM